MTVAKVQQVPSMTEREWVQREIARFDAPLARPDYPYAEQVIAYCQKLREYNGDGNRPECPKTKSGHCI